MSLINCFSFISNNIEKTITLEKPLPSITEPINVNLPTLPFVPQNNYYLDKLQNELEKKSLLQSNDGTVNIASFNSTLPDFSKTKIRRLSLLLSKIFTIKIYDNIEIKISPISILKEHNRFCKEKNIPVQAIEIVGSAVFYILGASYITKLLTIKGIEKKLLTSKILEIFTSPPSDYDIRIHFSLINNENFRSLLENFNKIISQLIENLIKEKVPEINNYRLQEILYRILPKSALFNNVKNIYTINRITPDDSFPFEFLGIYKQERAHLFAGDALRLKTADANLIKKDKVFSAPTFESSWNNQLQPLFDRLLRLIRSDNIDTINYRSWSNYISLLSKGYRCVDEKLEIAIIEALDNEILYDRLGNKRNLTDKICFLISHALENHVSTTPSNIFALTFIATEMLMYHKKINIKEALDIWDYLCHRFNVFQQPSPNEELSFASKMMALSFGDEPNSLTHFVVHYLDILGITSIPNQLDLYHSSHIGKPIIIAELLFSHPNGHATSSSSLNPYLQVDYNPPYALDNGIKTLMILYDNGNNKALDEVFTILDSLTCHDCIDDNSLSKNPYSLEWTYSFMESKIWLLQYLGMRIIIKKDLKELPVSTLIAFIQYFPKIIINSKLSQNFWLKSCIHFLNRVNEDKKINENDWNETVDSLFNGSSQLSAAIYEKWLYALIKTKSTMIINAIVASWKNKQYPFSEYLWVICGKNILKLINDTHLFDSLSILYALHENQSIGIAEKHSFLYKLLPLMSSETHVQRYPNSFFEKSYRVFFDNFNANYKSINRSQIFEIADFYLNILKNFNIPSMAELFIFCLNNDLFLDQEPILLNHLSFLNENNENIDLDTIWNHLLINKIILTLKSSIWSSLFLNAAQSSIVDKQLPSCRDLFKQQITTLDINFIATDDISLYKTLLREYPKKELSDSLIDQFANHKSVPSFALVLIKNYLKRNTFKKAIEAIKTAPLETFSIEEVFELNSLISKLIGKLKERLSFQDNREQSIVLVHELLNTVCGKRWTNENPYIAIDVLIELFNHHSDKISQSTHVYFISFFAILCSLLRQYNTFFVRIVCQNENIITIINKYLKNNWHPSTSSSLRKNLFDIFFDFTEHCISVNDYHNYFSFIDHYCLYTSDKNCKIENKKWFETAFITYFLENDDVYPSENIFKLAFEIVAPSQLFRSLQKNLQFNNNLPFFNIQQWTNRLLNIKQTKASPEFALIFSEAAITHDYDDDAIKLTDTVISNINYLKHSKIICNIIDNLSDNLKKNNFTQKIKTYSFFFKNI